MSAHNVPSRGHSEPALIAECVRCADCDSSQDRYDAYEVREPQKIEDGTAMTRTFWICQRCWDRIVSGALMSALRGL